jgi:hypothetical protein
MRTKVTADPVATFTLCLVVIAAAQAAFFVVQLTYMRIGMRDATIAAKAARDGALAAIQANEINRKNSLVDQRPWVGISALEWDGLVFETHNEEKVGATSNFSFKLKNFGKTPALGIFTHLKIGVRELGSIAIDDGREAFRNEILSRKSVSAGFAVFPTETEEAKISASVVQSEIDAGTISASFGRVIYPHFWVGVGYSSANGDCFCTIVQFSTAGIVLHESGKDRPIHQMSTYAT